MRESLEDGIVDSHPSQSARRMGHSAVEKIVTSGNQNPSEPFLHFLCTTCGHSCRRFYGFASGRRFRRQNPRQRAAKPESFSLFRIGVPLQNRRFSVFLNCTKNTELTARPFARTFCFASESAIDKQNGMDKQARSRIRIVTRNMKNPSPEGGER